jgi:hypothetical protein
MVLGHRSLPGPDVPLDDGQCLVLWLAAVLTARRLLAPDLQYLVLDEYGAAIRAFGEQLGQALGSDTGQQASLKSAALTLIDGAQLARFSGQEDFLDLKRASRVARPERPPLEFLTIDLTALFARMRAAVLHGQPPGEASRGQQ